MPTRFVAPLLLLAAGLVLVPVRAEADTLADLVAAKVANGGVIPAWSTTVTHEPAASEQEVSWTAAVVPAPKANKSSPRKSEIASYTTAGPRLTGEPHLLDGIASYYWQGQITATGEAFDKRAMTAAHRTLPFGTKVRVTRVDTGSSVVVRINDRGPFKPGRVIDLSERAAEDLGMTSIGLTPVRLEVVGP